MSTVNQIKDMLKEVYDAGDVNAMTVFKFFSVDTGEIGWHFKKFGRSEHVYLGNSVGEAKAVISEIKESRQ